jgi:hypothetical protein
MIKLTQAKFLVAFMLIGLLSVAMGMYFPWWSIAVAAFVVGLAIPQKSLPAFLCGFLALFVCWGGMALRLSSGNEHILAHRISALIIKRDSPQLLMLLAAVIGALIGGMATLTGSLIRKAMKGSGR